MPSDFVRPFAAVPHRRSLGHLRRRHRGGLAFAWCQVACAEGGADGRFRKRPICTVQARVHLHANATSVPGTTHQDPTQNQKTHLKAQERERNALTQTAVHPSVTLKHSDVSTQRLNATRTHATETGLWPGNTPRRLAASPRPLPWQHRGEGSGAAENSQLCGPQYHTRRYNRSLCPTSIVQLPQCDAPHLDGTAPHPTPGNPGHRETVAKRGLSVMKDFRNRG